MASFLTQMLQNTEPLLTINQFDWNLLIGSERFEQDGGVARAREEQQWWALWTSEAFWTIGSPLKASFVELVGDICWHSGVQP